MPAVDTPVAPARALRRARVAVVVAFLVSGAGFANWAARIPAVKDHIGLSTGELGIALLGPALGALASMPVAGVLMVRYGSRVVTRASLVVFCLVLPLPALAPSLPALVAALVLFGSSGGALDVAMNGQAVAVEQRYRRPLLAGFHGIWSLGTVVGALLGGAAAAVGLAPAPHLALAAALLLVLGVTTTRWLLPSSADRAERGGPRLRRPTGALVLLAAIAFCGLLCEGAVYDWSTVYLRDSLGSSEGLAVSGYVAFTATMTAGRLVGDAVRARIGSRLLLGGAAALASAGLCAGLLVAEPVSAVVGFALLGAGLSCLVPIVFSATGGISGVNSGAAIAAISTVGYGGFIVGPPLIGALGELLSLAAGLGVVVALTLAVTVMARWLPGGRGEEDGGR
ncbi:MAG TPA: MFS transporter [Actinomycetes bacterium]|nr:MFS transporter [Actinomycetes bacterium]